jgi:hypothetical protein
MQSLVVNYLMALGAKKSGLGRPASSKDRRRLVAVARSLRVFGGFFFAFLPTRLFFQLVIFLFLCHQTEEVKRQLRHLFQQLLRNRLLADRGEVLSKDFDGNGEPGDVGNDEVVPHISSFQEFLQLGLVAHAVGQTAASQLRTPFPRDPQSRTSQQL